MAPIKVSASALSRMIPFLRGASLLEGGIRVRVGQKNLSKSGGNLFKLRERIFV